MVDWLERGVESKFMNAAGHTRVKQVFTTSLCIKSIAKIYAMCCMYGTGFLVFIFGFLTFHMIPFKARLLSKDEPV